MPFTWDPRKNRINLQKHGIAFEDVQEMFSGPMLIGLDEREDYQEERWIGVGMFKTTIAVVVFTETTPNTSELFPHERQPNMNAKNMKKKLQAPRKTTKDEDIDCSDIPELGAAFFSKAKLRLPTPKPIITIRLDADVLAWLKNQGRGYQTRINAILRTYMEHRKEAFA